MTQYFTASSRIFLSETDFIITFLTVRAKWWRIQWLPVRSGATALIYARTDETAQQCHLQILHHQCKCQQREIKANGALSSRRAALTLQVPWGWDHGQNLWVRWRNTEKPTASGAGGTLPSRAFWSRSPSAPPWQPAPLLVTLRAASGSRFDYWVLAPGS